ncbi:MAG: tetraacyldisaccharide 4'-kinase [Candidatus Puniceispirillales bacterium]
MPRRAPSFWQNDSLTAQLLTPLSLVWRLAARLRQATTTTFRADCPVICIGNIMSGGTGKTPIAAAVAAAARTRGWQPVILTRGYGGSSPGPLTVDTTTTAAEAGDEALWLAQTCPVVISRDRARGARHIMATGLGDLIIMDDGMQNPGLHQDRLLVVFGGRTGLMNGRVIPAGPLREPLPSGLARADAVAISGDDSTGITRRITSLHPGLAVAAVPRRLDPESLALIGKSPVIAFAGIGDNDGFFTMLEAAGIQLLGKTGFADHHPYTAAEIGHLRENADRQEAVLVTTEKDKARLGKDGDGIIAVRLVVDLPDLLLDKILPRR